MQCPKCQNTMREREKGDVIIDVCPACNGIWLDSGEMEKLVRYEDRYYRRDDDDDDDDDDRFYRGRNDDRYGDRPQPYDSRGRTRNYPAGRRKSFLGGLMENFGGGADD